MPGTSGRQGASASRCIQTLELNTLFLKKVLESRSEILEIVNCRRQKKRGRPHICYGTPLRMMSRRRPILWGLDVSRPRRRAGGQTPVKSRCVPFGLRRPARLPGTPVLERRTSVTVEGLRLDDPSEQFLRYAGNHASSAGLGGSAYYLFGNRRTLP